MKADKTYGESLSITVSEERQRCSRVRCQLYRPGIGEALKPPWLKEENLLSESTPVDDSNPF